MSTTTFVLLYSMAMLLLAWGQNEHSCILYFDTEANELVRRPVQGNDQLKLCLFDCQKIDQGRVGATQLCNYENIYGVRLHCRLTVDPGHRFHLTGPACQDQEGNVIELPLTTSPATEPPVTVPSTLPQTTVPPPIPKTAPPTVSKTTVSPTGPAIPTVPSSSSKTDHNTAPPSPSAPPLPSNTPDNGEVSGNGANMADATMIMGLMPFFGITFGLLFGLHNFGT